MSFFFLAMDLMGSQCTYNVIFNVYFGGDQVDIREYIHQQCPILYALKIHDRTIYLTTGHVEVRWKVKPMTRTWE